MAMRVDTLASGPGWDVRNVLCSAGPRDRPFEEQHQAVCIAAVLGGSFQYRTTQGSATLVPGSVLLGNHGHCFECGHAHASGDRCLSFLFAPACFETILAAIPGARSAAFPIARLPPLPALAPVIAAAALADPGELEEVGLDLAAVTVSLLADADRPAVTSRDERRIARALHRIETGSHHPLTPDRACGRGGHEPLSLSAHVSSGGGDDAVSVHPAHTVA